MRLPSIHLCSENVEAHEISLSAYAGNCVRPGSCRLHSRKARLRHIGRPDFTGKSSVSSACASVLARAKKYPVNNEMEKVYILIVAIIIRNKTVVGGRHFGKLVTLLSSHCAWRKIKYFYELLNAYCLLKIE